MSNVESFERTRENIEKYQKELKEIKSQFEKRKKRKTCSICERYIEDKATSTMYCIDCKELKNEEWRVKQNIKKYNKKLKEFLEGPKYLCEGCDKGFFELNKLRHHKSLCKDFKKFKYGCPACGKKFKNVMNLRKHQKNCNLFQKQKNLAVGDVEMVNNTYKKKQGGSI